MKNEAKSLELKGWLNSLIKDPANAVDDVDHFTPIDIEAIYIALQDIEAGFHYEWNSVTGQLVARDGVPTYAVELIARALREGKQKLIIQALALTKKDQAKFAMRRIVAWRKPRSKSLTKAELLKILEKKFPDLYVELPTSKKGMSIWWAEAGLDHLPQSRGYR